MRITDKHNKRFSAPHPHVSTLISSILESPNEKVVDILEPISSWKWPRSDLHSWIKVLNKFDEIYEQIIHDHHVDKMQDRDFSQDTKRALLEILKFQRLLLENSTNRKLFSSYDRLNCLLFTSDVDVLLASLQLILRPAQQYSAQPSVSQALSISTTRLQALAKHSVALNEYGISMADIASEKNEDTTKIESLPSECGDVKFHFYRQSAKEEASTAGPAFVHIPALAESAETPFKTLADYIVSHEIPPESQFDLLCRIRTSWSLGTGKYEHRIKLLTIRLLAIAIYAHTQSEADAQSNLFLYEPDLISHIADLLQLSRSLPTSIRTAAVGALDGLARYRGKIQEVLTAVNAGVNHGILMSLLRRTIADMQCQDTAVPQAFAEILLTFISFLATHNSGGNMIIGAGLIPLLIQIAENKLPSRLAIVSKSMSLIDNILYGYPNAFQIFVNAGGVSVMVERISCEVEVNLQEDTSTTKDIIGNPYGYLPVNRAALLKHLLRSVHRMMHSSGTSEGLRGLIDSSLVVSIKRIIEHRAHFGATVLPLAINVMTTFVHNEPTSLPIIQEAALPKAFYDAIEAGLEPSMEVIQAIPNAIGALCLNQAGLDQFNANSGVIPQLFNIFTSEKHVKVLEEKDNGTVIGSAIDELVRHQPSISTQVFSAIGNTLDAIEHLGAMYKPSKRFDEYYSLVDVGGDVEINGNEENVSTDSQALDSSDDSHENESATKDNIVVSTLDVFCRFLDGFFQHVNHCQDFITKVDGVTRLGKIIGLSCFPYDFAHKEGTDAVVAVLRTMVEVSPKETLGTLVNQVQSALNDTRSYWDRKSNSSALCELLEPPSVDVSLIGSNARFRNLLTLHTRITILSDVCQSAGYPQGRSVNAFLQVLTGVNNVKLVSDLGSLHRICMWEKLALESELNDKGLNEEGSPLHPSASTPALAMGSSQEVEDVNVAANDADPPPQEAKTDSKSQPTATSKNAKALTHFSIQLTNTLGKFFQALVKMFLLSRRNPDTAQRKQAQETAALVAEVLLGHLSWDPMGLNSIAQAYHAAAIELTGALLFDERTSQNSLHTGLLVAFSRKGGIQALLRICENCGDTIGRVASVSATSRSSNEATELLRSLLCLKNALTLLYSLTSAKPLLESGQTTFLITPGKKIEDPDYFEPHDLICRVRLATLPVVCRFWRSTWLAPVAGIISREVIQILLCALGCEGEEAVATGTLAEPHLHGLLAGDPRALAHQQVEPDQERVRQLCDMGFPRSAAERALQRTNNNVNAATEYLLAHPLPFPPDPAQEPVAEQEPVEHLAPVVEQDVDNQEVHEIAPSDRVEISTSSASPEQNDPPIDSTDDTLKDCTPLDKVRSQLDELRSELKNDFGRMALRLCDEQPGLIFEVKPAFVGTEWKDHSMQAVFEDIQTFSASAHDIHERSLALRLRLLALVIQEPACTLEAVQSNKLMEQLLAFLLAIPDPAGGEQFVAPQWLAPHLLVLHALLIRSEAIRDITLPSDGEPVHQESLFTGPIYNEARTAAVEFCMKLLNIASIPYDELLAVLRLLVHLTREQAFAIQFMQRSGPAALLSILRKAGEHKTSLQLLTVILFRHALENSDVLKNIMKREITRRFSQPRSRVMDVATFMRQSSSMMTRDPALFLEVSENACELVAAHPNLQHITLKSEPKVPLSTISSTSQTVPQDHATMQVDETPLPPTSMDDHTESLMHLLIGELLSLGKIVKHHSNMSSDSEPAPSHTTPGAEKSEIASNANTVSPETDGYLCFLMQCMTELLFSYDSCKAAFMSYSKKRTSSSLKDGKTKPSLLNFLLFEVITQPPSILPESPEARRMSAASNWGMSVILALCIDTKGSENKDDQGEISIVRKFVIEAIGKGLKDSAAGNSTELHYARVSSLADLTHRLLSVKGNFGASKERDDTPLHLAKIMLEKNFVATLTNALADVDSTYPGAKAIVSNVLKPLEQLTKIAIKMGRPASKVTRDSALSHETSGSASSSEDDNEEMDDDNSSEDAPRDETPDLYRNSALGMYGGQMDDLGLAGEDDEMVDDVADDEDDEMEYDDVADGDSENTSDDMDGSVEGDLERHGGSQGWHEEMDEEMDEEDGHEEEDHVDMDATGMDAGEEDMWQDIAMPGDLVDDERGEDGEDNGAGDVAGDGVVDGDDDDDEDADSEGFNTGLELLEGDDEMGGIQGQAFDRMLAQWINVGGPGSTAIINRDIVVTRPTSRRRAGGVEEFTQLFGHARIASDSVAEPTDHPLLIDLQRSQDGSDARQRVVGHRNRGDQAGLHHQMFSSLEDLVGGGALQILQQLLGGGPDPRSGREIVGVEVPGAGIVTVRRGGRTAATRGAHHYPIQGRSGGGESFSPLPSVMRWAEEAKITHGSFITERTSKFGSHLTLKLIPAARQAAKEAEEAEALKRTKAEEEANKTFEESSNLESAEAPPPTLPSPLPNHVAQTPVLADHDATMSDAMSRPNEAEADPDPDPDPETHMMDTAAQAMEGITVADDISVMPEEEAEILVPVDASEIIPPAEPIDQQHSSNVVDDESGPSTEPSRVQVMIHGSPVDITDTGIDPTFLEALPDEMREEVLNQHFREQRSAAAASRATRPPDSHISAEFLDALPPEIRAELLDHEAEQARRTGEQATEARVAQPGPVEMDSASFLATLDPQLRQVVLMEQDDNFLQSLPSAILAEAGAYREELHHGRRPRDVAAVDSAPAAPPKPTIHRDSIHLLDKPGIALLVSMLFYPQISRKNVLLKILANLCENSKARGEVYNILLVILADATNSPLGIDRNSINPSHRPPRLSQSASSKVALRQKPVESGTADTGLNAQLVIQRCIEALTFIANVTPSFCLFFLSEQEMPSSLRKGISKKGKGKEKQSIPSHIPIATLLSLLEKEALLGTPTMMDALVALLATVAKPLDDLVTKSSDDPQGLDIQTTEVGPTTDSTQANPQPDDTHEADNHLQTTTLPSQNPNSITTSTPDGALTQAPQISASSLKLVVNILTAGECSSKTFQHSLSLIQHLAHLPGARDTVALELKIKAQELGQTIADDLNELSRLLQNADSPQLPAAVAAKFSAPSAEQAKFLRVLKTIDYMFTHKQASNLSATPESSSFSSDGEKVHAIYESFDFTSVWQKLGDCLGYLEHHHDVESLAAILLPLIESLMVVCKHVRSGPPTELNKSTLSPLVSTTPRDAGDLFVTFTDSHRKVLNLMVRNNPSLMSGSFSLLVNNPRVLDFDNKRNYFTQQLRKRPQSREHHTTLQLNVRRERVFEDSYQYLQRKTGDQIKYGKLSIRFYHEEGVDAGGLTREWFTILARQMFNPDYALFQPCAADKLTYQPNRASDINPEHLSFFKFVGRIIGKAIYDGRLLDAYFARSLYRQLLGKPVDYRDVEWVDPEYYKSLIWILENDPSPLDLTFIVEDSQFGVTDSVPLKENGATTPVTQENKREYVQLSAEYRLVKSIKAQIDALLGGFYEIIPKELISIFNEQEVELLISGTPDIDVDEWRAATDYHGYSSSDPVISWWWRALKSFNREERAKVLSFATGTARVPLGGFVDLQGVQGVQRFSIHKAYGDVDRLPQAHTCFNQIDLPEYSSYEKLRIQLLLAINEGSTGFGFA